MLKKIVIFQHPNGPAARAVLLGAMACSLFLSAARSQSPFSVEHAAQAALPDAPQPQMADPAASSQDEVTVRNSPRIFLRDQEAIWTSPARLRPHDLRWLVPMTLAVGAAIATDHRAMSQVVSRDPSFNNASINTSNALVGGMLAAPVALFASGQFQHDAHARETGILGSEAVVDGLVVSQVFKLIAWRERPNVDQARGRFFQSSAGVDGSFFSMHTTLAFSAASAIASEYPSPWTQIAVYSGAAAVGVTRVLGREHFPSDVLVGATAGWLIGHYVVKRHRHAH